MVRIMSLYTLVKFAQCIKTTKSHLQLLILICAWGYTCSFLQMEIWRFHEVLGFLSQERFPVDFYPLFFSSFYQKGLIVKIWKKRSPGKLRFLLVFLSWFNNKNIFSSLILIFVYFYGNYIDPTFDIEKIKVKDLIIHCAIKGLPTGTKTLLK